MPIRKARKTPKGRRTSLVAIGMNTSIKAFDHAGTSIWSDENPEEAGALASRRLARGRLAPRPGKTPNVRLLTLSGVSPLT